MFRKNCELRHGKGDPQVVSFGKKFFMLKSASSATSVVWQLENNKLFCFLVYLLNLVPELFKFFVKTLFLSMLTFVRNHFLKWCRKLMV